MDRSLVKDLLRLSSDWMKCAGDAVGYEVWHDVLQSAEAVQQIGAKLGLERPHILAVHLYTWGQRQGRDPFDLINGHLRGLSPLTGAAALFIEGVTKELQDALARLPGQRAPVYRSTDLGYPRPLPPLGQLGLIKEMDMRDPGFLSASLDPTLFRNRDLLLLEGHSGRDISALSHYPHEQEVIFAPGTRFSLRHVETVGDGLLLHLVE